MPKLTPDTTIKRALQRHSFDELLAALKKYGRWPTSIAITSPEAGYNWIWAKLRDLKKEVFGVLYLDTRHRVIENRIEFTGTIDGCAVYPREIMRSVVQLNAAAVLLYHNHPSGVAEPSNADELITKRIRDSLNYIDVRVIDHIVVGHGGYVSLATRGLI